MAILATQKVLTLDYWKMACDITEGDILFDRQGKPVKVKLVQQYRAQHCYEVQFNDGLTICGDDKLQLPLENEKHRQRIRTYKQRRPFRRQLRPTALADLSQTPLTGRENRRLYSVPTTGPIELPTQPLAIPPFVFGFWFFNRKKGGEVRPYHQTYEFVERKFKESGYKINPVYSPKHMEPAFTTSPDITAQLKPLVPTKIPNNYLLASAEQRLELLRGIMHAKPRQYNKQKDKFRFTLRNKHLVQQVQYLLESLGCKTVMEYDASKNYYKLNFKTKLRLLEEQFPKPLKIRQDWRLIHSVTEIKSQNCVHIETNGKDNSFLVGEGFIACL
jgi:hypothetical protein